MIENMNIKTDLVKIDRTFQEIRFREEEVEAEAIPLSARRHTITIPTKTETEEMKGLNEVVVETVTG